MESENLIPVVCWTKKNFASEFPISNLKNMPMEIEDPETNEEAVPVFASHEVDEEDQFPMELDDSEEESDNLRIVPTDAILVAGKIESEFASIEVYVFEEKTENLFVHHDFILGSFPISLGWLGANFSKVEGD